VASARMRAATTGIPIRPTKSGVDRSGSSYKPRLQGT
jgi:hypothetical protein